MNDNTLMIMATIENVNNTLNSILSLLEEMKEELHEVDYRTLRMTNYDEDIVDETA